MTVADDLLNRRLEQSCACGRWEAAGAYCTACLRPMGPADWYPNGSLARRALAHQEALENPQTPISRRRGRPRAESPAGSLGL